MVEEGTIVVVYHLNHRSIHKVHLLGITIIKDTTVALLPMVVEAMVVVVVAARHIILSHQVNITVDKMKDVIQAMDMDGVVVVLEYEIPWSCSIGGKPGEEYVFLKELCRRVEFPFTEKFLLSTSHDIKTFVACPANNLHSSRKPKIS
jgi:hypothetical protein